MTDEEKNWNRMKRSVKRGRELEVKEKKNKGKGKRGKENINKGDVKKID